MKSKVALFMTLCAVVILAIAYFLQGKPIETCEPFGLQLGQSTFGELWDKYSGLDCQVIGKSKTDWVCYSPAGKKGAHPKYEVLFGPSVGNLYDLPSRLEQDIVEFYNPHGDRILEAIVDFRRAAIEYYEANGLFEISNVTGLKTFPYSPDVQVYIKDPKHPSHELYEQLSEKYGKAKGVVKFPGIKDNAYRWDLKGVVICLYAERLAFYYSEAEQAMLRAKKRSPY